MSAPPQKPKMSLAISQSMEIIYDFLLEIFPELYVDCHDGGIPDLERANYQMQQDALTEHNKTLIHAEQAQNEVFTRGLAQYFNTLSRVELLKKIGETSKLVYEATQESRARDTAPPGDPPGPRQDDGGVPDG
ncbi:hypothetical protein NPX13_g10822 [Xylaria arbuscula]|uniref:Uncharacterized protein n=1 Tax=Xylaria arbuscula TaxID=114810 RepID=A0A9W8TG91_9PEZI|nr:hypothetical protein NPX13_g10822 [Xylaria arbuscula]